MLRGKRKVESLEELRRECFFVVMSIFTRLTELCLYVMDLVI